METIDDGNLKLVIAGPTGYANNIYLLVDTATGESAFVDAPDVEKCAEAADELGLKPSMILLTHGHPDHIAGLIGLKEKYGCTVVSGPGDEWLDQALIDRVVGHQEQVCVGNLVVSVIANPGHTVASTTYRWGKHAFVGDTLFPGGPGRTRTNADLQQEIGSITARLYSLDPETVVWPGHGAKTTIAASKLEYADFASRTHAPDLAGDVSWATS